MNFKSYANKITDGLLNDKFRQSFLIIFLSGLLAAITGMNTIIHFVNDPDPLFAIICAVTFVLSSAVLLLTVFVNKYHDVWRRVFMAVLLLFFGYHCWDGGPDGFLHLWILLVPAFSFLAFGLYEGFIITIPIFLTMVAFFWWPLADFRKFAEDQANLVIKLNEDGVREAYALSVNMRLRITFIYIVAILLGFFAELVRSAAAKRLRSFTENFRYASMHDSLTGLANQNFLAKYLDETYQNRTPETTLGCLFVDVDNFKNVNDTYGHIFGNVVLVRIAEILSEEEDAFVCRWGGDEYVVCITNVSEDHLMRIGEKFRAAVSACTFKDYPKFHITVSVGVCVIPVDENFNFDHVLDLADFANRTAKSKGKDNVSAARK